MPAIQIIQDDEDKDVFYACFKASYDQEHERSIIAMGSSELEAYKNAALILFEKIKTCSSILKSFGKSISDTDFCLNFAYEIQPLQVNKPLVCNDGMVINSFSAMYYDNKEKIWHRSY